MSRNAYVTSLFLSVCATTTVIGAPCPASFNRLQINELATTGRTGEWDLVVATRQGLENLHRQGGEAVLSGQTGTTCHYDRPSATSSSVSTSSPVNASSPAGTSSRGAQPTPLTSPATRSSSSPSQPTSSSQPSSSSGPSRTGILKAPGTPSSGRSVRFGGEERHTVTPIPQAFQTPEERQAAMLDPNDQVTSPSGGPRKRVQDINREQGFSGGRVGQTEEDKARQRELDRRNAASVANEPETTDADWE